MGTCEPVTEVRKRARKAKRRYESGIGKGRKCQWAAGKGGKGSGGQIGENQGRRRWRGAPGLVLSCALSVSGGGKLNLLMSSDGTRATVTCYCLVM
jgi:hypothetical protein